MIKTAKEILLEKGYVPDDDFKLFPTKNFVEYITKLLDQNDVGEVISLMPVYGKPTGTWEKVAKKSKRGFCCVNHDVVEDTTYVEHLLYFDTERISHADTIGWLGALGFKVEGDNISLPTDKQV